MRISRDERSRPADDQPGSACRHPPALLPFALVGRAAVGAQISCSTVPQGGGLMRPKHSLAVAIVAGALFLTAPPVRAENPAWSFSALGGYSQLSARTHYPAAAESLADLPVFGARFSRGLGQFWALELAGSYGSTHSLRRNGSDGDDVTLFNVSGSLIAQLSNDSQWGVLYLLGGGGYTQYKVDGLDDLHYGTFEAGAGWRVPLGEKVSIRLEARNLLNV